MGKRDHSDVYSSRKDIVVKYLASLYTLASLEAFYKAKTFI